MMDEAQSRVTAARVEKRAGRRRLLFALLVVLLIMVFVVPPWVSIGRYKTRIAQSLSASVGRPVQISSVELRLIPWPGFQITNLSIAEDPAYGAEPVLHANSVRASVRLLSLWQGKLEIDAIHVDEASLNIVRAGPGSWNLDPLFRTAAAKAGGPGTAVRWPSLDATDSRINIKNGAEKLPFSLVNTDFSLWQEDPGEWRIRLQGQPARTDVALDLGDTGTMRIEASMKRAAEIGQSPVRLDLDWRDAQLGQLSRLLVGSDPGWRGDLTGNLHLEGTPAAAQITTRLQATNVHRFEFAPPTSLDFDVNCSLLYRHGARSIENLNCDSPLGNGRVRVTGRMPGGERPAHFTAELNRIPVGAGLDLLRTLRSGLAPDLEAAGTVSGRIDYSEQEGAQAVAAKPMNSATAQHRAASHGPLSGSVTLENFALSGGSLTQPIRMPKVTLQAVEVANGAARPYPALEGSAPFDAGAPNPLNVTARFSAAGYEASFRGQTTFARARELAQIAGWSQARALGSLAGDPLQVNLTAAGPWLADEPILPVTPANAAQAHAQAAASAAMGSARWPIRDSVTGTISLQDTNWKANYLASVVRIAQATVVLDADALRWDPVEFSYGPVKGSATIDIPVRCVADPSVPPPQPPLCAPQFHLQFGQLNVGVLEAAMLGAREKGTLLSSLIDRIRPAAPPSWPALRGTISADALALGPVKLEKATAAVTIASDHADLTGFEGNLLGGQVQGAGTMSWDGDNQKPPAYSMTGHADKLKAAAVGLLLGQRWSGGTFTVGGKVDLAGFTDADLAASAKGTLHFAWSRGAMPGGVAPRFDAWSGDAQIGDGAVTLAQNEVVVGRRRQSLEGSVTFGAPLKVKFALAKSR